MTRQNYIDWPDNKKFVVCLTHDVDRVKKTYQYLTHFLKTGELYHLNSFFSTDNPYWNFERIITLEEELGVRSTFFFLNEQKRFSLLTPRNWKLYLGRYRFNEPEIRSIIQRLDSGGWEIGVHGSYHSYLSEELLTKEKRELEEIVGHEVIGVRQHYLNLEIPRTWEIQNSIGFMYDASFGLKTSVGFRDNKSLPFHPLNNDFLVIPLGIMDGALFSLSQNMSDAWNKCKHLIDETEEKGGVLTLLWHQHVFNEKEFPGWSKLYEKIIIECQKRGALVTTCNDLMKKFHKRCLL